MGGGNFAHGVQFPDDLQCLLVPHPTNTSPADIDEAVIAALAAHPDIALLCGEVRQAEPQAGLTNRVFRLRADKGDFFLRLPRVETAGSINRKGEAENLVIAAGLGLALPALFIDCDAGVLLTAAVSDLEKPEDLPARLGLALGALHGSGEVFHGRLDPHETYLAQRRQLRNFLDLPDELRTLEALMERFAKEEAVGGEGPVLVPSHGDMSPGNCLATPDRLWLIDWEYSGMSDPAWDLAYTILEHGFDQAQEVQFLAAYRSVAEDLVPANARLARMKSRCNAISALWALEQVASGRDRIRFLGFAKVRLKRIFDRKTSS